MPDQEATPLAEPEEPTKKRKALVDAVVLPRAAYHDKPFLGIVTLDPLTCHLVERNDVPAEIIQNKVKISQDVLDRSPKAYGFEDELDTWFLSREEQIKLIWAHGLVAKEEIAMRNRSLILNIVRKLAPHVRNLS